MEMFLLLGKVHFPSSITEHIHLSMEVTSAVGFEDEFMF